MADSGVRRRLAWPRTIRGLSIVFGLVAAIVVIVLGRVTLTLVHRQLELRLDAQIQLETRSLRDLERDRGLPALLQVVREREAGAISYVSSHAPGLVPAMGYMVLDPSGRRLAGSLDAGVPKPGYTEFIHIRRADGSVGVAQGVNTPLQGGGRLIVAADRAVIHQIDARVIRLFEIASVALLTIGILATVGIGRIFRDRLRAFEQLAQAVTDGDIDRRMPLDGTGIEFDRLSALLNTMMDRISALISNLRDVSTAIAHDLRTPLSRIRARIELAEGQAREPALQESLSATLLDIDAMLDLFAGLLAISEIDGNGMRDRFGEVDLAAAVSVIAEAHRPAIEDEGGALDVCISPASVIGDRALLQRLVGNLLDNAIVHTPAGSDIHVVVETQADQAVIRIADTGAGVPPEDHMRIFDRLVRLDQSRSSPGHGLGLSLVAAIAAAHHGTALAVPSKTGLTIEIRLPRVAR